jgi:hypothetical protein
MRRTGARAQTIKLLIFIDIPFRIKSISTFACGREVHA